MREELAYAVASHLIPELGRIRAPQTGWNRVVLVCRVAICKAVRTAEITIAASTLPGESGHSARNYSGPH